MNDRLREFADAVASYCTWSASSATTALADARAALRHLSQLYLLAQGLREFVDAPEVKVDRIDDAEWRSAYERFGVLPVGYYRSIFSPHIITMCEAEVGTADLADDLADIYRDLSAGLALFCKGQADAAEREWAWSFRNHWGRHAASAMHALHCWFADEGVW